MSLAYGSLAGNVTATALVLVLAPARPLPGWRRDDAVALLRVGLPLAGTSLVLLATLNVDYVVVGRQLGTTALGLYLLAFNLSSWPSTCSRSRSGASPFPASLGWPMSGPSSSRHSRGRSGR